jgi:uncharacterized protein YegL
MAKKSSSLLEDVEFAAASNKIIPLLFVLDVSSSMQAEAVDGEGNRQSKIEGLRQGLEGGLAYLRRAPELKHAGRVATLTFGASVDFSGFSPVDQAVLPSLASNGGTPFCSAVNCAVDETYRFTADLNSQCLTPAMTTIVVITDGCPTDGPGIQEVARLMNLHNTGRAFVWGVGVDGEDRKRLEALGFPRDRVVTVGETSWPFIIQLGTVPATQIARGQSPMSCKIGN